MVEAIERKIGAIKQKAPLDIKAVDFTVQDPDRVLMELGPTLAYFQRVEAMVTGASLEALLPASAEDYTGRFIHSWVRDEQVHGQAFDILLGEIGMTGIATPDDPIPAHNKIAGWVAGQSEWVHGVLEMIYHTTGALHEKLTAVGYKRLEGLLAGMGETAIVETMINPIQRDEATHLGYYRTVAQHLGNTLSPRQIRVAHAVISRTYAPVGAGAAEDKPAFGGVLTTLADGESVTEMTEPIQAMASRLLQLEDRTSPTFVVDAIEDCLDRVA